MIVRDARDPQPPTGRIALYARVSSLGQKEDVERQIARLKDYAAAKGYQVAKEVAEIASGLNDQRPKLEKLLADGSIGTIVVENRDRLTRFGSHYIETLLTAQGRHLEILFASDTGDEPSDPRAERGALEATASLLAGNKESSDPRPERGALDANASLVAGNKESSDPRPERGALEATASLLAGNKELVDDFVAVITSMAARIYGRRQSKRRAEKIKACVESVMQSEASDPRDERECARSDSFVSHWNEECDEEC